MKEYFTFAMLFCGSVMDIRKKELPRIFLLVCGLLCALLVLQGKPGWDELLMGLLPGVVLWVAGPPLPHTPPPPTPPTPNPQSPIKDKNFNFNY